MNALPVRDGPEADWLPAYLTTMGQEDCKIGIRMLEENAGGRGIVPIKYSRIYR